MEEENLKSRNKKVVCRRLQKKCPQEWHKARVWKIAMPEYQDRKELDGMSIICREVH